MMPRYGHRDPRDTKSAVAARRQEFDVAFAAGLALIFVLRESPISGFCKTYGVLVSFAVENGEYVPTEDDPEFGDLDFDSMIDSSSILGSGFERVSVADAMGLHDQLFPTEVSNEELLHTVRGLAVASIHSALERYFKSVSGCEVHSNLLKTISFPGCLRRRRR